MRTLSVRRGNADFLFTTMLISFAIALIGTRVFLNLTGWPQIANDLFHIAHVLWGGIIMFIALMWVLLYRGKFVLIAGSVLAGIGWALFIDELGKFITVTNNYHFRPAAPLIYLTFVIALLVSVYLKRNHTDSVKSKLYDAMERLEEAVEGDMDYKERLQVEDELNEVLEESDDPAIRGLAKSLIRYVNSQEVSPPQNDIFYEIKILNNRFNSVINSIPDDLILRIFRHLLILKVAAAFIWVIALFGDGMNYQIPIFSGLFESVELTSEVELIMFTLLNILRLLMGLILISAIPGLKRGSRRSYRTVMVVLWISIGIVNVFDFYFYQFSAATATLFDATMLGFMRDFPQKIVKKK